MGEDNVIVQKRITLTNLKDSTQRTFEHIQFKEWPDHSTPNIHNYVMIFENLFNFVDVAREKNKKTNNPILIHCSAGIGRTGVFLTLYAICNEIKKQISSDNGSDLIIFNVFICIAFRINWFNCSSFLVLRRLDLSFIIKKSLSLNS